jgi:mono/diheme cytochrome c family protein
MKNTAVMLLFYVFSQSAYCQELGPAFTDTVMKDTSLIALGQQVWDGQCRHCHGNSAYPGKAPKLKPSSYQSDFVYDRVTNGFRKMPAWREIFNEQQRVGVTVYIMSDTFAP